MKRVVTVLLCFIIFANLLSVVLAASVTEITSYGFLTQEGRIITLLNEETIIKGYVDINNTNYIDSDNLGELVVECYIDGVLQSTQSTTITIDRNTGIKRVVTDDIAVPQSLGDIVFKVFISKISGEITPIIEMHKIGTELPNAQQDGVRYAEDIEVVKAVGIMSVYEEGGRNVYKSGIGGYYDKTFRQRKFSS